MNKWFLYFYIILALLLLNIPIKCDIILEAGKVQDVVIPIDNPEIITGNVHIIMKKNQYSFTDFDAEIKDNILTAKVDTPISAPSGFYTLENKEYPGEVLATLQVKGLFPSCESGNNLAPQFIITPKNKAVAGSKLGFNIDNSNIDISIVKSDKLLLLFEKEKDVAYFATSCDINNPFIILPKTMPGGEYKVYYSLNKDFFNEIPNIKINIKSNYTEKTTDLKPISYGFFKDSCGQTQMWWTNQSLTLFWNGESVFETSGMVFGPHYDAKIKPRNWERLEYNLQALKKHGINHVYLYGIFIRDDATIEALQDMLEYYGFTYTLGWPCGDSLHYPKQTGWTVRAGLNMALTDENKTESFQRDFNLNQIQTYVNYRIPVIEIKAIIYNNNKELIDIRPCEWIPSNDINTEGMIKVDLTGIEGPVNVTYTIHEETNFDFMANLWADSVYQTKNIGQRIKNVKLRPGFRGFVDMVEANERGIHSSAESIFYDTKEFLDWRVKLLVEKYRDIEELKSSWQAEGDFVSSIEEAAKLYPVLTGDKIYLISCENDDKIFTLNKDSIFWYEYCYLRDKSLEILQTNIVNEIKKVADVPIIYKEIGTSKYYNTTFEANRGGFDGAGYELYNMGDGLVPYGLGYFYAQTKASKKAQFAATTEINRNASDWAAPNYPDIQGFFYDMSVCQQLGSKITYLFVYDLDDDKELTRLFPNNQGIRDQRMLEWSSLWNELITDKKNIIEDFKPYIYNSWPIAANWWWRPNEREAVRDMSDAMTMLNCKAKNGVWILNCHSWDIKTDLTCVTLNDKPATEYYKDDFEELLSKGDREIVMCGLRKDLGTLSVDKYYTDETFTDDKYEYQVLKVPSGAKVLHKTEGKVWAMRVGKLQICAAKPLYANTLDEMAELIDVPPVKAKGYDGAGYAKDVLGITFATFGDGVYKAVGYKLKGKDVSVIHTTKKRDDTELSFIAQRDCEIEQYVPGQEKFQVKYPFYDYVDQLKKDIKYIKKGEEVLISFPQNLENDEFIGAGKGTVKIVGVSIDELRFENVLKDKLQRVKENEFLKSALHEGLVLPKIEKIEDPDGVTIERYKAMAGFNMALDAFNRGDWQTAHDKTEEYFPLASINMVCKFLVLMGHASMMRGNLRVAQEYYRRAFEAFGNDPLVMVSYGCALYDTDRERAIELWKEAGTEEAQNNLKFAEKDN